ncbi:M28 family metallopeptidase [Sphingosinicella terrae]|uniref:M28 family metallopeptidase n=1 Tax=Sphingosinicella terrae TaxID=2172047 RepID=UPI000E0D3406|nr:M28 family peptidase [Sphingosinicella terrae]
MTTRSALALLAAAGVLAGCATAPSGGGTAPQIPLQMLQRVTEQLSSDAFEGRAPGTAGEERTAELLAREFERAGLQPGNNGSWYQEVPLVEISARGSPQLRVTGSDQPLAFDYRTDMVAASYRVQPRVEVANSEIVFVGYGINAPERGWNDYEGLDVRGKTVIILVNDPDWSAPTLDGPFNGRAMTYYGRWTYKYEEAARQGAAAAFIVHDDAPAAYGWNVVENSWTGPQLYMQSASAGADQTAANGWLTNDAARRLLAAAGQDLDALTRAAQQRGFRAVPLAGLRASITLENDIRTAQSRNIVGILPGTTRPDEYVLYTAHWDHLGICREEGQEDRICNGAIDNATGTAALVALAQAHARAGRPDRSIVFLAVTAEESGLLGSAYYAANPIYPLARTAGGINIDSLSMQGDARDFSAVGAGKSELDAYLQRAAAAENLSLTPEPSPQAGYYYRSDHFSMAKQGVPMVYAKLGPDLIEGGRAAGDAWAADYRANRYHGPADEYDPDWDWTGALRELRVFYRIGRELAESSDWPNWNEGDEFRAIRDRSRVGQ